MREGVPPCPFAKFKKTALILEKKCRNYIHLKVKLLIYKAVVSVTRKKISEIFPCGAFVSFVADYVFIEVPLSEGNFPALKLPGYAPVLVIVREIHGNISFNVI